MSTSTCNPKLIDDFLADRLDDAAQRLLERHLDECDQCCERLNDRTADPVLWHDTRAFLSSTEIAPTLCGEAEPQTPTSESVRLDFLNPTDDPHMLGRFGGYEISGVIGCGGMGIVLKGFDAALNRYSAIKVLSPHYASSGAARQRFAREAQAAAAVVHDNVIGIHGVSECNGLPYLEMPYVKGESLQKRIDREGSLTTAETLRIALQTAKGLAAAHDQGLVHRDIKPANILLPENVERVLITDFGLARAADDASLTRSGVIAGTPQYMSPEQARGEGIDHRSDLFSLGSVMYAMATGHPPFRAETPYGILRRITDDAHRPIRDLNPEVPNWLSHVIDRLLSKQPSQRFTSADEVASLLEDCLAHVQHPATAPLPASLKAREDAKLFKKAGHMAVALLLLTCVISVAIFLQSDEQTDMAADPADGTEVVEVPSPPAELPFSDKELQWQPDSQLDELERTLDEMNREIDEPPLLNAESQF